MLVQSCVALAIFIEAFLLGSIPWGVVLSRLIYHDDVRKHGSGNIGTTNMIRSYGKKVGYACFVLDFAKAIVACLVASVASKVAADAGLITVEFADTRLLVVIAGFGVVLGHVFCPWLKFKGGKGVACGAGVAVVAFGIPWFLMLLAAFIVFVFVTKAVSAGSLAAAVLFPFMGLYVYWGDFQAVILCFAIALVVIWSHRSNIERLSQGTENKIGGGKKADRTRGGVAADACAAASADADADACTAASADAGAADAGAADADADAGAADACTAASADAGADAADAAVAAELAAAHTDGAIDVDADRSAKHEITREP